MYRECRNERRHKEDMEGGREGLAQKFCYLNQLLTFTSTFYIHMN